MEPKVEYQVLAPDSVAWHIQAALVADRSGNEAARDLALREALRITEERRLVEQAAPAGSRVLYDVTHEYNGTRLGEMEREQQMQAMLLHSLAHRLDALEAHATETDDTLSIHGGRIDNNANALVQRLKALEERLAEIDELAAERAVADDTLLSVDLMAVYDMMARRERARDGA